MNILMLQSPYSFFFNDVGKILKEKGNTVKSICFNLGDQFLKKDLENIKFWKEIRKIKNVKRINEELLVNNLYFGIKKKKYLEDPEEKELIYFSKYYVFIEDYIKKEKIDIVLMHNDLRWQHDIAIKVAKKYDIKYYVFELGLFRPNSITMDPKGVNAFNSVIRDITYYKSDKDYEKYSDVIDSDITEKKRNLILAVYILLNGLGKILGIEKYTNNKNTLLDYMKRFYNSYIKKRGNKSLSETEYDNYIFVPLQVTTDTQTIIHSRYHNMEEFMDDVIDAVDRYRNESKDDIKLVIKEHPMDVGKVNYDTYYKSMKKDWIHFLVNGDTNKLLMNSNLVITINSTVGLEAIMKYKRVLCLGEAFYAIEGICEKTEASNLQYSISDNLKRKVDRTVVHNFIKYLKYEYSVEGNEYFYNKRQLNHIVNIIEAL